MSERYTIHPERSLVVITRVHHVGTDEWAAFMTAVIEDPQFEPGFSLVDDRRDVRDVPRRQEVERAALWIQDHASRLGCMRWAIVVDPAALAAFGMARVVEALTSHTCVVVRASTDVVAATAWAAGRAEHF
jgi:hypothetical protein